jgi:dCTP deaminase
MSLLSHEELIQLVADGVITGGNVSAVNAASIDIHLGGTIMVERQPAEGRNIISYSHREGPKMREIQIGESFILDPNEFILAHSVEVFNLPPDISCEYKLKSSMARIGLEHMNAGWCDAGWQGSVLTLEFKNMTRFHSIRIRPGDAIGQMVFFRHAPVSYEASYAARGRYNNNASVEGIKV